MSLDTAKNALQVAIAAASGIPGSRVIWEGQNGEKPATPYISLSTSLNPAGQIHRTVEDTNLTVSTIEDLDVRVTCFSDTGKGDDCPENILNGVRRRLRLPSISAGLVVSNIGILGFSKVSRTDPSLSYKLIQPRGTIVLKCRVVLSDTETVDVIETVGASWAT